MPASVTAAYATPANYRAVVGKTDSSDDAEILVDLQAVSRYIDREYGRFFTSDVTPVARVYAVPWDTAHLPPLDWAAGLVDPREYARGPWRRLLQVDDLAAAPTSVIVDEDGDGLFADAPWSSTTYELWPLNAAVGPEPEPWTALSVPPWSAKGGFPAGARVQITAAWGWPAVPAAILRLTCHLAGILRLESPRATTRMNEMDQVISTSKAARDLLANLAPRYGRRRPVFA
jgi:hypothetical protein